MIAALAVLWMCLASTVATAANATLDVAAQTDKAIKAEAIWWLLNLKDGRWGGHGLANALKSRGIKKADRVLVYMPMSIQAVSPTPKMTECTAPMRAQASMA